MASVPVVNDMVPVTGRVSAVVEEIAIVLAARDRVSAALGSGMVVDPNDLVQKVCAVMHRDCWGEIPHPTLGLMDAEQVMHGGALEGPVLMNGFESSGIGPQEIVLRGGRLKKPRIITDLIVVKKKQFITLDKAGGLCEYLTCQKPYKYPLKHVHVFDVMQKTMIKHCKQLMDTYEALLLEDEQGEGETAMSRLVGKTKSSLKPRDSGHRDHRRRGLSTLPNHGAVDMSRLGIQWHPVCLIQTGTKNVAVEATAENFAKLFEIVSKRLVVSTALIAAGVHTPGRKLRRRPSHMHAPRGPPEARELYIKTKGWCKKGMKDPPTPGSAGSGSSHTRSKNRRFLKITSGVSTAPGRRTQGKSSGSRPSVNRRVSVAHKKRSTATQVLSRDGPADHEDTDCESTESNPFA